MPLTVKLTSRGYASVFGAFLVRHLIKWLAYGEEGVGCAPLLVQKAVGSFNFYGGLWSFLQCGGVHPPMQFGA